MLAPDAEMSMAVTPAPLSHQVWKRDGAQGRNRTTDTVIFSHVLYQLSYLGLSADSGSCAL